MSKRKAWYDNLSQRAKDNIINVYLANADTSSGLWMDRTTMGSQRGNLIALAKDLLSEELSLGHHPERSDLLKKICAAQDKSPSEIAANYIKDLNHQIDFVDDGQIDRIPYVDLVGGLLYGDQCDTTLRKLNEYYEDKYPRKKQLVNEYKDCVLRHGDQKEGWNILYKLYVGECNLTDFNDFFISLFLMGYEGWKSSLRLPFVCAYKGMRDAALARDPDRDDDQCCINVRILFAAFDSRTDNDDSLLDDKNVKKYLQNAGSKVGEFQPDALLRRYSENDKYFKMSLHDLMQSPYFKKYYRNRRRALCAKIGCDDDSLEDFFSNQCMRENSDEQFCILLGIGEFFNIQPAVIHDAIRRQEKGEWNTYIEKIVQWVLPTYYVYKLDYILDCLFIENGVDYIDTITRRDLYNKFGADDTEKDISFLSELWVYNVLLLIANQNKQKYYENLDFFNESAFQTSQVNELKRDLASCEALAEKRGKNIEILTKKLEESRPKHKESSEEKNLRKELVKAEKKQEESEAENEELRKKLKDMEDYVSMIESAMTVPQRIASSSGKTNPIDEALLHSIRIVFVCGNADQICPDLRKSFPGSLIHETATQKAALKKTTDLVVYFTQHISHTMFFRFRSAYEGIPQYYFNGTNIDKLKTELSQYIRTMPKTSEESASTTRP